MNNEYIVLFGGKNLSYFTTSMYVLKPLNEEKALLDISDEEEENEKCMKPVKRRKKMSIGNVIREEEQLLEKFGK